MAKKEKRLNTEQFKASPKASKKGKKAVEKKNAVLEKLKVEYVAVDAIKPNQYNPNRQSDHDFDLLQKSMAEDGFTQPIVVQAGTKTIVDGEHRWRAAAALGMKEIPVVFVEMTPEQMRIATLRHNRARGSEDLELSAQVLRDLRELGALEWAQDSLNLDDAEIDKLLNDIPAPELLAEEEYSQAWVPAAAAVTSTETTEQMVGDEKNPQRLSMTPQALESIREREKKIATARTQEERAAAERDSDIYRLALMFAGDEAKIVRAGLGDHPAARILEWCREAVDIGPPSRKVKAS